MEVTTIPIFLMSKLNPMKWYDLFHVTLDIDKQCLHGAHPWSLHPWSSDKDISINPHTYKCTSWRPSQAEEAGQQVGLSRRSHAGKVAGTSSYWWAMGTKPVRSPSHLCWGPYISGALTLRMALEMSLWTPRVGFLWSFPPPLIEDAPSKTERASKRSLLDNWGSFSFSLRPAEPFNFDLVTPKPGTYGPPPPFSLIPS